MRKIQFIILFLSTLISCDKKQENITPNIVTFPMSIGSQWTYDRQIVVNRYESKISHKIVGTDTYNSVVKVWVDKDTVLNGKQVVKFVANDQNWDFFQFKFIDQEGLKTYAYRDGAPMVYANAGIHFKSATLLNLTGDDRIMLEKTPPTDLKLPLQINSVWTYSNPTEISAVKIVKQVTGAETLTIADERFNCLKIDWIYTNDSVLENFQIRDWMSEKGLVKRTQVFDEIMIQNENGQDHGFGQLTETLTLKSVEIK